MLTRPRDAHVVRHRGELLSSFREPPPRRSAVPPRIPNTHVARNAPRLSAVQAVVVKVIPAYLDYLHSPPSESPPVILPLPVPLGLFRLRPTFPCPCPRPSPLPPLPPTNKLLLPLGEVLPLPPRAVFRIVLLISGSFTKAPPHRRVVQCAARQAAKRTRNLVRHPVQHHRDLPLVEERPAHGAQQAPEGRAEDASKHHCAGDATSNRRVLSNAANEADDGTCSAQGAATRASGADDLLKRVLGGAGFVELAGLEPEFLELELAFGLELRELLSELCGGGEGRGRGRGTGRIGSGPGRRVVEQSLDCQGCEGHGQRQGELARRRLAAAVAAVGGTGRHPERQDFWPSGDEGG